MNGGPKLPNPSNLARTLEGIAAYRGASVAGPRDTSADGETAMQVGGDVASPIEDPGVESVVSLRAARIMDPLPSPRVLSAPSVLIRHGYPLDPESGFGHFHSLTGGKDPGTEFRWDGPADDPWNQPEAREDMMGLLRRSGFAVTTDPSRDSIIAFRPSDLGDLSPEWASAFLEEHTGRVQLPLRDATGLPTIAAMVEGGAERLVEASDHSEFALEGQRFFFAFSNEAAQKAYENKTDRIDGNHGGWVCYRVEREHLAEDLKRAEETLNKIQDLSLQATEGRVCLLEEGTGRKHPFPTLTISDTDLRFVAAFADMNHANMIPTDNLANAKLVEALWNERDLMMALARKGLGAAHDDRKGRGAVEILQATLREDEAAAASLVSSLSPEEQGALRQAALRIEYMCGAGGKSWSE